MKVTTLVLLEILSTVYSFDFQDPQQTGVEFVNQNSQVQVIVDEYNGGGKITIVQIINAEEKPEIALWSPNGGRLEAEIQQDSNPYMLQINRFDYESLLQENVGTTFTLEVKDSTSEQNLTINIKNLDDENPILEPFQPGCFLMEEIVFDVHNSTCGFRVSDPDGWLNLMTFTLTDYSDIFEVNYRTPPDDNLVESDVYLVLKDGATLDYEENNFYNISTEAKDSAGNPTIPNPTVVSYVILDDIPPVWTILPDDIDIDEEKEGSFIVKAIDPDPHHPKQVRYQLEPSEFFAIDEDTGLITWTKIDRDAGFIYFSIRVTAFYTENDSGTRSWGFPTFVVHDIDDNPGIIYQPESTSTTITAPKDKIFGFYVLVNDLDEGLNSINNIEIDTFDEVRLAVDVHPQQGSRNTIIYVNVDPATVLRSNPYLTDFKIELWTKGFLNPQNRDNMTFTIHLEGTSSGKDIKLSWVISTVLTCIAVFHLV